MRYASHVLSLQHLLQSVTAGQRVEWVCWEALFWYVCTFVLPCSDDRALGTGRSVRGALVLQEMLVVQCLSTAAPICVCERPNLPTACVGGTWSLNTLKGLLNCLNAPEWCQVSVNIHQQNHSETGSMYCIIKCIVQGKQTCLKNADLHHPSCTVVM